MSDHRPLKEYRDKRCFSRSPEPDDKGRRPGSEPIFVIQQHGARTLHYDFRLEVAGVLKSWAVPKGPATDPKEKRLAVPTEDHPLDYADFEGVIPPGEYGAGAVVVWDQGVYRNLTAKKGKPLSMEEGLAHGHVKVWLEGRKLRGGYALNRFKTGKDEAWLLVKVDDELADPTRDPVKTEPQSVLSGRTLEEVAAEG
ncbi:MAG: DNA ligase [Deltaproteobacteria bacterium]|nr:DNA ligase [Deltaproteobacteria bacterium]